MSQPSVELAELVNDYSTAVITLKLFLAATALFCFNYILTFTREVQRIWKLRFTTSAILFYCVRYSALFNTIFIVLEQTRWNGISDIRPVSMTCWSVHMLLKLHYRKQLCNYAAVANGPQYHTARVGFGVLRSPRIRPIGSEYLNPRRGFDSRVRQSYDISGIIGARASSVVTDFLVLTITVLKTRPIQTEAPLVSIKTTVADILMRDGALYFAILLVANVIGLGTIRSFSLIQPMSTWIGILTAIMTSRFILDLHEAADPRMESSHEIGTLSTTVFSPRPAERGGMPPFDSVFGASTLGSGWFDDDEDKLVDSWKDDDVDHDPEVCISLKCGQRDHDVLQQGNEIMTSHAVNRADSSSQPIKPASPVVDHRSVIWIR
ncbi:hypothetical protein BN946_scf184999.g26 [Trametes cinnabarina]|uniref:DUF6533 domain-containing protein n=1 Tax=Pycnoporus cinnabarinus TaxID=5643 RepID=A0A060S835_PYCCI|nr:hypothetical protein BN946_scf184999.g26 [Trametes cinnabarina]